jgi:hypothetical protein
MVEELKDPRLIETYVRNYNSERERLAGNASAERLRLEAKRDRVEGERRRNIDLVIKYVISEEDAKQRIAELKQARLRVEAELAALEEAPTPISATLRPSIRLPDSKPRKRGGRPRPVGRRLQVACAQRHRPPERPLGRPRGRGQGKAGRTGRRRGL